MFLRELLNSSKFSLNARLKIEQIIANNNIKGNNVITEALLLINKIYIIINKAERIKTVFLKTLIIDRECFNKLEKLILEGPKYLEPLMEGIDIRSFSIFLKVPEKLFQIDFSLIIFLTVILGKQVQLPNFIELPVKVKVINLCI